MNYRWDFFSVKLHPMFDLGQRLGRGRPAIPNLSASEISPVSFQKSKTPKRRAEVAWGLADIEIISSRRRKQIGKDSAIVHILLKAQTKQELEDKLEAWLPTKGYRLKELGETAIYDAVGWESEDNRNVYEALLKKC